jgi:hypothetical protein
MRSLIVDDDVPVILALDSLSMLHRHYASSYPKSIRDHSSRAKRPAIENGQSRPTIAEVKQT